MTSSLDDFGMELVDARDDAISQLDRLLAGGDRSERGSKLKSVVEALPPELLGPLRALTVDAIDNTLHLILWMFERSERFEIVDRESGDDRSLARTSDGFSGEIYTEDGWFARFSRFGLDP